MIKVLTIEREYGSGAAEIAQKLADRLGWKLWDQLLTDEIARRLECDSQHVEQHEERRDPLHYRLFKAFLRGSFEGSLITPQMKMADAEGIRRVAEQLVRRRPQRRQRRDRRARLGLLSARPARFLPCFHLCAVRGKGAPVASRQGRARRRRFSSSRPWIATARDFIKQYFGIEWPARHFFHLMINSTMGEEAVVQTVLDGLSAIEKV